MFLHKLIDTMLNIVSIKLILNWFIFNAQLDKKKSNSINCSYNCIWVFQGDYYFFLFSFVFKFLLILLLTVIISANINDNIKYQNKWFWYVVIPRLILAYTINKGIAWNTLPSAIFGFLNLSHSTICTKHFCALLLLRVFFWQGKGEGERVRQTEIQRQNR
jgi:hypothetical protein